MNKSKLRYGLLADRLRLGWLLTTPDAMALIPGHDQQRLAALDFAAGETIAATDPDLIVLHSYAIAHRRELAAATVPSPAAKPTGTLRALLAAVGWKLQKVGRIKARGGERDAYTHRTNSFAHSHLFIHSLICSPTIQLH
jgi:hypothetical protein